MSQVPAEFRQLVIERAGGRCEYCHLHQEGQEATFHIDHVVPVSAGGPTVLDNLALACVSCSLRKAARTTVIDPDSQQEAAIFNPRKQAWNEHFKWRDEVLTGSTPTGRATIEALTMNRALMLGIRREQQALGRRESP